MRYYPRNTSVPRSTREIKRGFITTSPARPLWTACRLWSPRARRRSSLQWSRTSDLEALELLPERKIKLIADCTEWYDPETSSTVNSDLFAGIANCACTGFNLKSASMIAISSFLERYYAGRGCHVVRVPPLVDLQRPCWKPIAPCARIPSCICCMRNTHPQGFIGELAPRRDSASC